MTGEMTDCSPALVTRRLSQDIKEVLEVVEDLFGVLDEDSLKLQ